MFLAIKGCSNGQRIPGKQITYLAKLFRRKRQVRVPRSAKHLQKHRYEEVIRQGEGLFAFAADGIGLIQYRRDPALFIEIDRRKLNGLDRLGGKMLDRDERCPILDLL